MDFIFRLAEEFLKKHKMLNRYRRVFAVIAAVVVFATTYELILPAITMDRMRAAETPGIEVGVAAEAEEEVSSEAKAAAEEEEKADRSVSEKEEKDRSKEEAGSEEEKDEAEEESGSKAESKSKAEQEDKEESGAKEEQKDKEEQKAESKDKDRAGDKEDADSSSDQKDTDENDSADQADDSDKKDNTDETEDMKTESVNQETDDKEKEPDDGKDNENKNTEIRDDGNKDNAGSEERADNGSTGGSSSEAGTNDDDGSENRGDAANGSTTEIAEDALTEETEDSAAAAAETADPLTPVITYPATIIFEGRDYTVTATFDEKAKLPADVKLDVVEILPGVIYKDENGDPLYPTYEEYLEKTLKALEKEKRLEDDQTVANARFFDIIFMDGEGHAVEPAAPVNIAVKYKDALSTTDTKDTMAVHFEEKQDKKNKDEFDVKVTDVIDTQTEVKKKEIREISFDAEKFSVYGILGIEIIEKTVLAGDGHNYRITVTCGPEAGVPEDADLEVTEITEGNDAYNEYVARTEQALGWNEGSAGYIRLFDIRIVDKNRQKVEIAAPVSVEIELADKEDSETTQVVHFADGSGDGNIVDGVKVDGESVSFEAEGFSIYAITDGGGSTVVTPRHYYNFEDISGGSNEYSAYIFINKNGEDVSRQIIKNGDSLDPVPDPYHTGYEFIGWYIWENDTWGDEVEFDTAVNVTGDDGKEITVRAKYDKVYYVNFHQVKSGSDPDIIQTTKITEPIGTNGKGSVLISDVIAPQEDESHLFYGWKDGATEYNIYDSNHSIVETRIDVQGNEQGIVNLYPLFIQAHWLRFISGETGSRASYVPAQFVKAEDTLTVLPIPTRKGYKFAGWYEGSMDDDGKITYGDQVTDGQGNVINPASGLTLSAEKTLYGNWTPDTDAAYKVVIWRQKVTDDKNAADANKTYDYAESFVRSGTTGDPANPSNDDISHNNGDYTGFHYARTVKTSETITADGSTVINVYYDRDLKAINFYYQNGHQPAGATTAYTYTATTSTSNNPQQYGVLEDGTYVPLTRDSGTTTTRVYYTYDTYGFFQTEYNGTFYIQSGNNNYTPTQYNGDNLPPDNGTTYYAYTVDWFGNINYSRLTRRTESSTEYHWTYNDQPYTGTRYTRSTMSGYPYMVTWTGLYGQSFSSNGYTWPSGYRWNEKSDGNGTIQTFLTGFTQSNNPYNLYDRGNNGSKVIYHYKQALDGKYYQTDGNRYTVYGADDAGSFNFQNKFDGFTVNSYNTGQNGYSQNGGSNTNMSDKPSTYPLHVYHKRNKWRIDYYSEGDKVHSTGDNSIYYEAPLTDYDYTLTQVGLSEREHYTFTGWYADETCTQLFDFGSTMPNANLAVYAGWQKNWYQIIVDPDGGEIPANAGATYFWKQYQDTFDEYVIQRTYIEDPDGDYKYVYVDGKDDPDGNNQVRTATYEPAEEGYTGTRYRKIDPVADPTYKLVGWYEVDENGNLSDTPYDFNAEVEGPVTIRAVWQLSGSYRLVYNATVTLDGETVSGTFTQSEPEAEYSDGAKVVIQAGPASINPSNKYVFDGWEIVNQTGETLDDNGGVYYKPGDEVTINAAHWADSQKLIHLQAHYTKIENSDDPVPVTFAIFDANGEGASTTVTASTDPASIPLVQVNTEETQVQISRLHLNQEFIAYGQDDFVRPGYNLLGWNHIKSEADAGIVEFECGQKLGADNLTDKTNTLYAVWEKKKYTVTVQKVVTEEAYQNELFDFTPSFSETVEGGTDAFKLAGNPNGATIEGVEYKNEKTFENVPFESSFSFSEDGEYYDISVSYSCEDSDVQSKNVTGVEIDNGEELTVAGNMTVVFTNTRKTQKVKILKTDDSEAPAALNGAVFTINGQTLASGSNPEHPGYTDVITIPVREDGYPLVETTGVDHYQKITGDINVFVSEDGVTVSDSDYVNVSDEPDGDGVYTITVVNPREIYSVTVVKNVSSTIDADQDKHYSFSATGLPGYNSFEITGREKTEDGEIVQRKSISCDVPFGTTISVSENVPDFFELAVSGEYKDVNGNTQALKNISGGDYSNGDQAIVTGDTTITFNNTRQTADVVVKKKLVNVYVGNTDQTFTFTVSCDDWGDNNPGEISVTSNNSTDGQETLQDVPVGVEMTITEAADEAYEYAVSASGVAGEEAVEGDFNAGERRYRFIVPANDTTVTFTNTAATVSGINVTKTDDKTPATGLSGAVFTLSRNNKLDGTGTYEVVHGLYSDGITSGEEGVMITSADSLPTGYYKLIETHAPDGHIFTEGEILFRVFYNDSNEAAITLVNTPANASVSRDGKTLTITNTAGQVLPFTGGTGRTHHALGGIFLAGISALMFVLWTGRRERRLK